MKLRGIEGLSCQQIRAEIPRGARFVYFEYCISAILITFKRHSDVYYLRPGQRSIGKSLPFSLVSFLLGWWGIPWGPIHTVSSLVTNFGGGEEVTSHYLEAMADPYHPDSHLFGHQNSFGLRKERLSLH